MFCKVKYKSSRKNNLIFFSLNQTQKSKKINKILKESLINKKERKHYEDL